MLKDSVTLITWDQMTIPNLIPAVQVCQRYCAILGVDATPLFRSDALAQPARRVLPDSCHTPFSAGMVEAFSEYLSKKATILQDQVTIETRTNLFAPLSLLLVRWRDSLFDGACTPETDGYIDTDCIPGWDTWVTIVELERQQDGHGLLCWVPPQLCREVDDAIAIDAASCMSWLTFDQNSKKPLILGWGQRWGASAHH